MAYKRHSGNSNSSTNESAQETVRSSGNVYQRHDPMTETRKRVEEETERVNREIEARRAAASGVYKPDTNPMSAASQLYYAYANQYAGGKSGTNGYTAPVAKPTEPETVQSGTRFDAANPDSKTLGRRLLQSYLEEKGITDYVSPGPKTNDYGLTLKPSRIGMEPEEEEPEVMRHDNVKQYGALTGGRQKQTVTAPEHIAKPTDTAQTEEPENTERLDVRRGSVVDPASTAPTSHNAKNAGALTGGRPTGQTADEHATPELIGYDNLKDQPDYAEYVSKVNDPKKDGMSPAHYHEIDPHDFGTPGSPAYLAAQQLKTNPQTMDYVSLYSYMTQEEKDNYDYIYAKYGSEEANKYMRKIEQSITHDTPLGTVTDFEGINERKGRAIADEAAKMNNPFVYTLEALDVGLRNWAEGVAGTVYAALGGEEALPESANQYAQSMIRETLNEQSGFSILGSGWKAALFDVGTSMAQQIPQMALSTLAPGALQSLTSLGTMAVSVFGNTYTESLREGYTPEQSRFYGLLSAATEVATEKIAGVAKLSGGTSIDAWTDQVVNGMDGAIKRYIARVGFDFAGEGLEEVVSELVDPLSRALALGDDLSVYGTEEFWDGVLMAGLEGGISGGLMGGVEAGTQLHAERMVNNQTASAIIDNGTLNDIADVAKTLPEDSKARRMAEAMAKDADGNIDAQKVGNQKIGEFYRALSAEVDSQLISERVLNGITQQLMTEFALSAKDADTAASAIDKTIRGNGEELTKAEKAALKDIGSTQKGIEFLSGVKDQIVNSDAAKNAETVNLAPDREYHEQKATKEAAKTVAQDVKAAPDIETRTKIVEAGMQAAGIAQEVIDKTAETVARMASDETVPETSLDAVAESDEATAFAETLTQETAQTVEETPVQPTAQQEAAKAVAEDVRANVAQETAQETVTEEQKTEAVQTAAEAVTAKPTAKTQATVTEAMKASGMDEATAKEAGKSVADVVKGKVLTKEQMTTLMKDEKAYNFVQALLEETNANATEQDLGTVSGNRVAVMQYAQNFGKGGLDFLNTYNMVSGATQDATEFYNDYRTAYINGKNGINNNMDAMRVITSEQAEQAWKNGRDAGRVQTEARQQLVNKGQNTAARNIRRGTVNTDSLKGITLTEEQQSAVDVSSIAAEAIGVNIKWYASEVKDGKRVGANGWYDPTTNTIALDIYAGENAENAIHTAAVKTLSHELTHYIAQWSPKQYTELRDAVFSQLRDTGMDLNAEIEKIQAADPSGRMTRQQAIDEIVAHGCERMLQNSEAIQNLAKGNMRLAEKIGAKLKDFKAKIDAAYARITRGSEYSEALKKKAGELANYADSLQKKWDAALEDAAKANTREQKRKAAQKTTVDGKVLNKASETIAERGGPLTISTREYLRLQKGVRGVNGVSIDGKALNNTMRSTTEDSRQLALLDAMGRKYGVEFVVHDSIADGALDGVYISDNVVHVSRNAMANGIFATGIHETVHMIRAANEQAYADMLSGVRGIMKGALNWEDTVAARAYTEGMNTDAAEEEMVAEAIPAVFANEQVLADLVSKFPEMTKMVDSRMQEFVRNGRKTAAELSGVNDEKGFTESMRDSERNLRDRENQFTANLAADLRLSEEQIAASKKHPEIDAMLKAVEEKQRTLAKTYENALKISQARAGRIGYTGAVTDNMDVGIPVKANKATIESWKAKLINRVNASGMAEALTAGKESLDSIAEFIALAKADGNAWRALASGGLDTEYDKTNSSGKGPLRTNVEYIYSFDPDTKCYRATEYQQFAADIEREMGRKLTARESQNLVQLMKEAGWMIPCRYCYLYTKRTLQGESYTKKVREVMKSEQGVERVFRESEAARTAIMDFLDTTFDIWNRYEYDAENETKLFQMPLQENGEPHTLETLIDVVAKEYGLKLTGGKTLSGKAYKTVNGTNRWVKNLVGEWLADCFNLEEHNVDPEPQIMDADGKMVDMPDNWKPDTKLIELHAEAFASAQSGVKPNKAKQYVAYNGELDELTGAALDNIIAHDGLRFQSSTDFRPEYLLDYMQLIADMATLYKDYEYETKDGVMKHSSVRGINGHMYTKDDLCAEILAPSGLHINCSVAFETDAAGNVRPSAQEGMDFDKAVKLSEQYQNVGVMAMVTDDAQLAYAMELYKQGKVHVIIPFHSSGLNTDFTEGMMQWKDYQADQLEKLYSSEQMYDMLTRAGVELTFNPRWKKKGRDSYIKKMFDQTFPEIEKIYDKKGKQVAPHFLPGDTYVEGKVNGEIVLQKVPGHHNDYNTFMALCKQYGVNPRFYNTSIEVEENGKKVRKPIWQIEDAYMSVVHESRKDAPSGPVKAVFNTDLAIKKMSKREAMKSNDAFGIKDIFMRSFAGEERGLVLPSVRKVQEAIGKKFDSKKFMELPAADQYRLAMLALENREELNLSEEEVRAYEETMEQTEEAFLAENEERILGKKNAQDAELEETGETTQYEDRDADQMSDRELLATALDSSARTAEEKQALADYRSRVRSLDEAQNRANAIKAQMEQPGITKEERRSLQGQYLAQMAKISKADKVLLNMEAMKPMQSIIEHEAARAGKAAQDKVRKQVQDFRARQNERLEKQKAEAAKWKTRFDDAQEEAFALKNDPNGYVKKQDLARNVMRNVKRLDNAIRKPDSGNFVPEELQPIIGRVVSTFTQNGQVFSKKTLDEMADTYDALVYKSKVEHLDPEIAGMLRDLAETAEGRSFYSMSHADAEKVNDIVSHFRHIVEDADKAFVNGRQEKISEMAAEGRAEAEARGEKKNYKFFEGVRKFMMEGDATPVYFFRWMGGTMNKLFNNLIAGEKTWGQQMVKNRQVMQDIMKEYHYADWADRKGDLLTLQTEEGKTVQLTRDIALGLWATRMREKTNSEQKASHLAQGGFVLEAANRQESYGKGIKQYTVDNPETYKLTDEDMKQIENWLSPEQKDYAKAVVHYMSNELSDMGNDVSERLYGYRKFKEKFYYPYKSAGDYMHTSLGQDVENSPMLKNMGMTKRTTEGANNPIIARPFTEVAAEHMASMCNLTSFGEAQDVFMRVFNYEFRVPNPENPTATIRDTRMRAILKKAYGDSAVKYMTDFMSNLYGGAKSGYGTSLLNKTTSAFKKAAVFANASVVVQQPSAIMRAMAIIDPKYFALTALKNRGKAVEEMQKYSGTAIIKSMGRFDMNSGRSAVQYITDRDTADMRLAEKAKAFVDPKDSSVRDDLMGFMAEKADEITWGHIWEAVKAEMEQTTDRTGMTDEEFLNLVGDRFDDVVHRSQVYDSVFARSAFMRSNDSLVKMMTSFMAEPTLSTNMLMDAAMDAKSGNKKIAARTVGALVGNIVFNAMLKAIVQAARDDDEDKTYAEKYVGAFTGDLFGDAFNDKQGWRSRLAGIAGSDLSPLSNIPFVQDIISIMNGYDVERTDMTVFSDLYKLTGQLFDGEASGAKRLKAFAEGLGIVTGVPVKNIWRDVQSVFNVAQSDAIMNTSLKSLWYAALDGMGYQESQTANAERLFDYIAAGNTEAAEEQRRHMTEDKNWDDKTVNSKLSGKIGEEFKSGRISEEQAVDMLTGYAGKDETEAKRTVYEWDAKAATGTDSAYDRMDGYITDWDGAALKSEIEKMLDSGFTADGIQKHLSSEFKPAYLAASKAEQAEMKQHLIVAYGLIGKTEEAAAKLIDKWE